MILIRRYHETSIGLPIFFEHIRSRPPSLRRFLDPYKVERQNVRNNLTIYRELNAERIKRQTAVLSAKQLTKYAIVVAAEQ